MTKRKQINDSNKSVGKRDTSQIRKKPIITDSSIVNVVDVQVQNIWEANSLFNKAGCGLPLNEIASISLTMNGMAQLNKFKSLRYNILVVVRNLKKHVNDILCLIMVQNLNIW